MYIIHRYLYIYMSFTQNIKHNIKPGWISSDKKFMFKFKKKNLWCKINFLI